MTTPPDIPSIATDIYKLLEPLPSEARKLAVAGAFAMLGDALPASGKQKDGGGGSGDDVIDGDYPRKAATWMKQNGITAEQLSHVFHDGELIAKALPGESKRENTVNTYVLCGISHLLQTGEPQFTDAVARETCKTHSAFDEANHSAIIARVKDVFTGSKKLGWKLTSPGLKRGAELVKQIAV
jgi:hypothetical protein